MSFSRKILKLAFVFFFGISSSMWAAGGGDVLASIKTAFEIIPAAAKAGETIYSYVNKAHLSLRNSPFLRLPNKTMVTMIRTSNGRLGIGHMKQIDSYGNDYYLYAQNSEDLALLDEWIGNNEYEKLVGLAENDNFKISSSYEEEGFTNRLAQDHLIVKGKGEALTYKGIFPDITSSISFIKLRNMLDKLVSAAKLATRGGLITKGDELDVAGVENFARILDEFKVYIADTYWFSTTSQDGVITVLVHWPTLLEKFIAMSKQQ